MVISHNLLAMNANRQFNITSKNKAKSSEKLSSGYRINRAADDAAGLSISEKMRKQIRGLSQGIENTQDGVSLCQVADGALAEVSDMLHRINELSIQSANGTNSLSDRQAIQNEIEEILQEIDRIGETTVFNEHAIFRVPDNKGNGISSPTMKPANILGNEVVSGGTVDISTITTAELYIRTKDVVRLTGANNRLKIICDSGSSLILDNIYMEDISDTALDFQGSGNKVTLVGDNYISTDFMNRTMNSNALVHIGDGTTVTFEGNGHLGVSNDDFTNAAAMGGNFNENGGNIICNFTQTGSNKTNLVVETFGNGAGIGGGENGNGGNLELNSGYVYVRGSGGAGIGGGENGNGGTTIINGGTLFALISFGHGNGGNYTSGSAIGGGKNGNGGTTIYNGGTLEVRKAASGISTSAHGIGAGDGSSSSGNFINNTNNVIVPTNQYIFSQVSDKNIDTEIDVSNYRNNRKLSTKSNYGIWIQSGCDTGDGICLKIDPMNTSILGINNLNLTTIDGAYHAMNAVNDALTKLSANRSKIGAQQNRLEHTIDNENNIVENTTASEARIRDTDMADEMVSYSKQNIVEQVGQSILSQANQNNQGVLSLLQ